MTISQDLDAIIADARAGSSSAFDQIVEVFAPRLYGFVFGFTGHASDAEDLVQEVFLRVVRTISSYQHDCRFEAWIFRIAMNLVRDRLRRKKRGPGFVELTSIAEETDEIAFADHANPQPTNPMDRAEQSACLTRCIARLPQVEREVIMLRHYSDMSFAEIADLMQSPLGTALARAHRGLAKLRQWMESSEQV